MAMPRRVSAWIVLVLVAGCRSSAPPPFPDYSAQVQPAPTSANYPELRQIGEDAERLGERDVARIAFTTGQSLQASERLAVPLARLRKVLAQPVEIGGEPGPPFETKPGRKGWRLLGRLLEEQAVRQVAAGDIPGAVETSLTLARLGATLTGGDVMDAQAGLEFMNRARLVILPAMPKMDAASLKRLSEGWVGVLQRLPTIDRLAQNDRADAAYAIQAVQEAYQKGTLREFERVLGPNVREAVEYLEQLKPKDGPERASYFEGFAKEADEEQAAWIRWGKEPGVRRAESMEERFDALSKQLRPWRRFAWHFLQNSRRILPLRDVTLARSRMLAIDADLMARSRSGQPDPPDLSLYPAWLTQDPYSGARFGYRPGAANRLYSVGPDFRDDSGETDATFESPDLTLERR